MSMATALSGDNVDVWNVDCDGGYWEGVIAAFFLEQDFPPQPGEKLPGLANNEIIPLVSVDTKDADCASKDNNVTSGTIADDELLNLFLSRLTPSQGSSTTTQSSNFPDVCNSTDAPSSLPSLPEPTLIQDHPSDFLPQDVSTPFMSTTDFLGPPPATELESDQYWLFNAPPVGRESSPETSLGAQPTSDLLNEPLPYTGTPLPLVYAELNPSRNPASATSHLQTPLELLSDSPSPIGVHNDSGGQCLVGVGGGVGLNGGIASTAANHIPFVQVFGALNGLPSGGGSVVENRESVLGPVEAVITVGLGQNPRGFIRPLIKGGESGGRALKPNIAPVMPRPSPRSDRRLPVPMSWPPCEEKVEVYTNHPFHYARPLREVPLATPPHNPPVTGMKRKRDGNTSVGGIRDYEGMASISLGNEVLHSRSTSIRVSPNDEEERERKRVNLNGMPPAYSGKGKGREIQRSPEGSDGNHSSGSDNSLCSSSFSFLSRPSSGLPPITTLSREYLKGEGSPGPTFTGDANFAVVSNTGSSGIGKMEARDAYYVRVPRAEAKAKGKTNITPAYALQKVTQMNENSPTGSMPAHASPKRIRGRRAPSVYDIASIPSSTGSCPVEVRGGRVIQRPYVCSRSGCHSAFIRNEHLTRHIRTVHSDKQMHICPHAGCGRRYSRRDNLAQHCKVHLRDEL